MVLVGWVSRGFIRRATPPAGRVRSLLLLLLLLCTPPSLGGCVGGRRRPLSVVASFVDVHRDGRRGARAARLASRAAEAREPP